MGVATTFFGMIQACAHPSFCVALNIDCLALSDWDCEVIACECVCVQRFVLGLIVTQVRDVIWVPTMTAQEAGSGRMHFTWLRP